MSKNSLLSFLTLPLLDPSKHSLNNQELSSGRVVPLSLLSEIHYAKKQTKKTVLIILTKLYITMRHVIPG